MAFTAVQQYRDADEDVDLRHALDEVRRLMPMIKTRSILSATSRLAVCVYGQKQICDRRQVDGPFAGACNEVAKLVYQGMHPPAFLESYDITVICVYCKLWSSRRNE